MCVGCSKEPSHEDGSFEFPQHMVWLRNKKNNFQLCTLIWWPDQLQHLMLIYIFVITMFTVITFSEKTEFSVITVLLKQINYHIYCYFFL